MYKRDLLCSEEKQGKSCQRNRLRKQTTIQFLFGIRTFSVFLLSLVSNQCTIA